MRPVYLEIADRAAADPQAPAVAAPGRSLTYGELDSRADRLALTLRGLGVGPEVIVALLLPRAPEAVVAALAVAKAGGAYLPLDPAYPEERLLDSVTDAGARVLLTTAPLLAAAPALAGACGATLLLDGDEDQERLAAASAADPAPLAPPETEAGLGNLAYVIYTSGSTGRPKGVEIEHRGLTNLVAWHQRIYNPGPGDRVTRLAGAGFDAAVWEIWPCLAAGACLCLPPDEVLLAPARLVAWLAENRITQTFLPTPLAEAVLEEPWPAGAALEVMLTGGDRLHRGPGPDHTFALANHYGPTEATVCATWTIVEPEREGERTPPPIGLPVDGTTVRLLDRDLLPVEEEAAGELLLGGPGLARGYRHRPALTAERFVPNPWGAPGERLYRTGDLVRELPAGDLDFIGRIDQQVKIRGYRIELGEIETVLRSHPGVREGVVLARAEGDERRLVGYVAARPETSGIGARELRAFLGRTLPEPMVPAAWVFLAALPLTPNGKVDRAALSRLAPALEAAGERVAPRNPVEERLAAIFGEVLGIAPVGALDDFFALGGHSLKATQVLSRVRAALGVELTVGDLYDHPTVAALARRVEGARDVGAGAAGEIQPGPRSGEIPLSYAQQELWFVERWVPGTPAYNTPMEVAFAGPLDPAALGRALAESVRRHEVLRTVYPDVSGRPVQRILPTAVAPASLGVIDLAGLPDGRAVAARLAAEEGRRPFDLERGPVLRTLLLRLGPAEHRLLLLLHHIVSDDWTVSLLLSELAALYRAFAAGRPSPLPEPRLQYADFALWQHGFLAGTVNEELLGYWRERLGSAPTVLELPADRPRPAGLSFAGTRLSAALPADLAGRLRELARAKDASLFMVLLAAWSALLGRYAGQDDLLVGVPSANRNRVELEGLIGLFVHTLVLRAQLAGEPSGAALVAQLRETTLGAYAHQDLPFQKLVDALQPARDPSRHPLVQVFFVFGNAPRPPRELAPGVALSVREVEAGVAKVDLSLYLQEEPEEHGGLSLQWEYPTALFDRATVERFHGHFRALLEGLTAMPEVPVSALPLLAPAERRQLELWNAESARRPGAGRETLAGLFAAQAARTPLATALVVGLERLTYADLAARADRLALRLAARGVGPEVGVALFLPRTADLVAAMLATLAAGGFYVPLDPAYPAERLGFLLADSGARVLVTVQGLAERVPAGAAERLYVDLPGSEDPGAAARVEALPANLAYLIYTSGSTGSPKAVGITHASAALLVRWAQETFPAEERAAVLAATSIAFDLSVFEIFLPLASGGTVVLADNVLTLAELPARAEVTLVNTVPSAFAELLRLGALPRSVRTVNLAGEALTRALADQVYARPEVERLYNLYGPSEDTTYSTFSLVERASRRAPAIGRPIASTSAHVLGRGREPLPVGVPGELHVGGASLARGYLGRPELTAERFLPDPFAEVPGARLYRTGDLARRRPAGELEFLGRLDHQVKVRGFRIELGEIEAALAACLGVAAAAVLARRDDGRAPRLVAYVAPAELSVSTLRSALAERLPDYMIPAAWVFLATLPLTPNGKVDRRALPAPALERPELESAYVAPRGRVEEILAEVWAEVLRLPRVGTEDNFFALGGDSILTIQVVARCRERGVEVVPQQIFRHQTVAALAATVTAVPAGAPSPSLAAREQAAPEEYPLSPAQQGMLMVVLLSRNRSEYYFDQYVVTLTGRLDPGAWREAWRRVVARHEALRTRFVWERRERPVQVVSREVELPWEELDWRSLPEPERERRLDDLLRQDHARGFDLGRAPLLRATLVQWDRGVAKLAWSFHHLILDGWSISLVLSEVLTAYTALATGRRPELPEPRPYSDYISWLTDQGSSEAEAFWRRELADLSEPAPLPFDGSLEEGWERETGGWVSEQELAQLPVETVERLTAFARGHRLTLNTLFQGAWALLLARLSASGEVVFGGVVSGRPGELPGVESIVGLFINALPVRVRIDPARGLLPWLAELQDRQVEQRRFEHSLLEQVQAWAGVPRERQLFASLLIFQNFPLDPLAQSGTADLQVRASRLKESTHYPLALYAAPEGEGMALGLSYHRHRFDAASARRLIGMLGHLLAGFASFSGQPEARLAEIPLLGAEERCELLAAGRGPAAPGLAAATVLRRFAEQVAATPEAVAVEAGESRLTYGELGSAADRLAGHLRGRGVRREDVVGVCLPRSLDLIVSLLAIWKAGAAYLPLDPAYPAERRAFMVADSGARAVLTAADFKDGLPAAAPAGSRPAAGDPADAAYVIYTSGSTGTPKGVVVEHGALASYVASAGAAYGVGPGDRVLQFASASFDTSAEEIYPCLTRGATLVLRDPAMTGSFGGFLRACGRLGITLLDLPTAYWHELVADSFSLPECVRLVILGGEAAQAARVAAWRDQLAERPERVRLINTYGPTEATIVATWYDLTVPTAAETGGRVPIGRAVPNVRTYVLGAGMEILPAGVDGELWIGGAGLARGYLGRPERTAARFRPNPFAAEDGIPGDRLYRTGDLVRQLPDGNLLFRGRVDAQVKVRGFRIELGEVEAALRRLPGVRDAAAVVQEEDGGGVGGRRLVAFVVPVAADLQPGELRTALQAALPEHMVPAALALLPALPLTASGKVDRTALARMEAEAAEPEGACYAPPRTPVEEVLTGIWGELLRVERVGVHDDFFALGGHSLLVAQALSRIRQALGVEVPLVELFRKPTVAELAEWIEKEGRSGAGSSPLAPLAMLPPIRPLPPALREGRPLPLSFAQERVWFLDQLTPGGNLAYNFQVAIRLRGRLDMGVLERTLGEIVRRHEVLRTSFPALGGERGAEDRPVQVVHPASPLRLLKIDLSGLPPAARQERSEALIEEQIQTPFDLARGPLIRWRLLRHDPEHHTLVQVEHHFVHDGWSLAIFLRELKTLYAAFSQGAPSPLPELPVQYADYAVWQREWMAGEAMERLLGYWQEKLAGSPPALEIATDRPRPPQGSFRGDIALLPVAPELYAALRRFARRQGFTLYMTMLAGFLALLHRYTGEEDLVIGTSNANRRAREIEGMIGMVVNSLVLRADLAGRPSFREHLGRVRELALATSTHQDMPFERLVQELRLERRPGRNPLFQLMFNFHDAPVPDFHFAGLELFPEVRGNRTAKMDMNVIVVPRAEQRVGRGDDAADFGAVLHWEYNTDLFDRATVERMAAHYQILLAGALADPRLALPELPLLTQPEHAQVLVGWNDAASDYPRDASIPEIFAAWAARTPGAVAVVFGAESLTYGELEAESNRLAHHLRALGAGPGDLVALAVERSLALVPAILGILKSGASYLPLDPAYPAERLSFMLADSGARLLLGQERSLARLPASSGLPTVCLDRDREEIAFAPASPLSPPPGPGDIAYVMYTSGSTGRPKGVAVTHRNVVRLVLGSGFARFGPEQVFLQLAPISFDASTLELWGPLLNGGRLAVFPPECPSLEALGEAIARHGVTTLWLTAGLFHQMVEGNLAALRPLTQLLAGGDVLSPAHVRRALAALPGLPLIDGYGPTEGTTFTCCHALREPGEVGGTVPIGRPIGNARVFVLDRELRPLPAGVPGELLLGGDGLALGYLGRPTLTAERFLPDPFGEPGGRLYRTGDRVRWLGDGTLELLGRLDGQVKIRGFRVEPGEIEAALTRHPAVREAAVVAQAEAGGIERRLVAYVAPREENPKVDLAAALRRHLAASLPAPMVPAAWVILPSLPLTANGKVDRRALLRMEPGQGPGTGEGFVAPRTPVEEAVAAIWREVLGVERLGIGDDFFLLGGHSLSATRVLSRLRRDSGVELALADLFDHTTLAGLAAAVVAAARSASRKPEENRIAFDPESTGEDLSEAQLDALLLEMLAEPGRGGVDEQHP